MPTNTFDIADPLSRLKAAEQLKADVDAWCVKEYTDDHRTHLGASLIGKECAREVWYDFRWCSKQVFEGRMLRLFNRGHMEEELFIKWLRAIGCQVWEVDPNTGEQFRIYGVQGHYGGSLDSGGIIPYFPDTPMLLEFKTHNTKSFCHLLDKKLMLAKPQHYSQMCSYGAKYQFRYGLYVAVNKNDDDLYYEFVELDWKRANDLENKAADIIYSQIPPPRIAENPSFYTCKYCTKNDICWSGKPVEINCRSCRNAKPVENKGWFCSQYNQVIPPDFIKQGCAQHISINQE